MSAVEQDLTEYLAGDEPPYDEPVAPPQDAAETERRLRRLAKVRADMAEVNATAQRQIDQAQDWRDERLMVLANKERWLVEGLEMWHRAVLADDPSRKTISLPCGTLKARQQQPVWEFDEEAFIAWASEHAPGLVRIPEPKPAVDKTAAKKALIPDATGLDLVVTTDGEVVPGVTVTPRPPAFTVDTGAAE